MRNKILSVWIAVAVCLTVFLSALTVTAQYAAAEGGDYAARDFSEVPSDWQLYSGCDMSHTSAQAQNGEIVIKHDNPSVGDSLYYGAMYHIATDRTWGDFTFEMTFKMSEPDNSDRWMGVVYHRNSVSDRPVGYLMNYRYNGGTAFSAISAANRFEDEPRTTGAQLADGGYHKLKIELSGTTARHYMDGKSTGVFDIEKKNSTVGGSPLSSGGFSVIVNRCTVAVREVKITDTVTQSVLQTDNTLVSTYAPQSGYINPPTVITRVKNAAELASVASGERRPSNAVIDVDGDGKAVGTDGSAMGSIAEAYAALNKKVIPIFNVRTRAAADALIKFMTKEIAVLDAAVMSCDPLLVKSVRTECTWLRGIVDYTDKDALGIPEKKYDIVKTLNMNYANVALVSQRDASFELVEYVQARFKTVWIETENDSECSILGAMFTGAYGIAVDDPAAAYDIYKAQTEPMSVRPIFNVAHRGLPNKCNENSLSGTREAVKCGATHVELDGKITTDGVIMMMHDDNISRTTNGSGLIENMTSAQVNEYYLNKFDPKNEAIPTLDVIMDELANTDVVLIFEIKTDKETIIAPLREAIERHDFWDKIVVIAFDSIQLLRMKNAIPEVPCAYLADATPSGFATYLQAMNEGNYGVDTSKYTVDLNERYLKERGIVGWYWTMNGFDGIDSAARSGYVGVTNNDADAYSEKDRAVVGLDVYDVPQTKTYAVGDMISLFLTSYGGDRASVPGVIEYVEDYGDYYGIVASYTDDKSGTKMYSGMIRAFKNVPEDSNIALIIGLICGGCVLVAAVTVMVVLIVKKKKNKADAPSES